MNKRIFFGLLFLSPFLWAFEQEQIQLGPIKMKVEVAQTDSEHAQGLMFRKSLDERTGMLFVFKDEKPRTFWMKNTFIPLAIGYFNRQGVLIDIQEMKASKSEMDMNPEVYPSKGPAQFALEVNPGWFVRNRVKVGSRLVRNPSQKQ
jgi:uncharacterized membrane protein (UPF0127 family)